MNGYKTGGDWTDVTSIGRNEVVFEGRHKEYGAFYIRQRYQNSLLLAQLMAISFVVVCAVVPYLMRNRNPLITATQDPEVIRPVIQYVPPKPIQHPVTHTLVTPPKPNTSNNTPPVITAIVPDSLHKTKPVDQPPVNPIPNPGPGGPISINPGPTGGGGGGGVNVIPRRDTFVIYAGVMPKFKGGNLENYLANKINYPVEENQLGVEGIVYASFIIEKDGSVGDVKLLRGVSGGPNLDKEALRVLAEMPKWIPGNQDGHPVRVQFTIPIHFKIH